MGSYKLKCPIPPHSPLSIDDPHDKSHLELFEIVCMGALPHKHKHKDLERAKKKFALFAQSPFV